jgi:hypothetical protein
MPKQTRPDDLKEPSVPNQAANKEPAEGSRETVDAGSRERGGGITNRPLHEELDNQERVPPGGENKERGHA